MLAMAFHMPSRREKDYHTCDLITDLLAAGQSSRLVQHLVHRDKLFTSIDAYIQGSSDEGLLLVVGRLVADVAFADAEEAVWRELKVLKEVSIDEAELAKVRNRSESERTFNNINYLNRAVNMAQLELIGQDSELADELRRYCAITAADVQRVSRNIFMKRNCCILKVLSKQS